MKRQDVKARLDNEIWECVCDCFRLDVGFSLNEATDKVREHVVKIAMLPYDYARGRVLGALERMVRRTDDIESIPLLGEYGWILPSRSE